MTQNVDIDIAALCVSVARLQASGSHIGAFPTSYSGTRLDWYRRAGSVSFIVSVIGIRIFLMGSRSATRKGCSDLCCGALQT